jgi:hypothetical protein
MTVWSRLGAHEEAAGWPDVRAALRALAAAGHPATGIGLPFGSALAIHPDGSLQAVAGHPAQKGFGGPARGGAVVALTEAVQVAPLPSWRCLVGRDGAGCPDIARPLPRPPSVAVERARQIAGRLRALQLAAPASGKEARGPNQYCNWVLPGRLLAGCFPCPEVWRREGSAPAAK